MVPIDRLVKPKLVNVYSNNNKKTVILDCNNKYMCGTLVKKNFEGINYNGFIRSYDESKNKYIVKYRNRDDTEELNHDKVTRIINTEPPRRRRRDRIRNRTNLDQQDLYGDTLVAKNSDVFGNNYSETPNNNLTIITFQNIGQQSYSKYDHKSIATSKSFRASHANIVLYAEISLNEQKIKVGEKFNNRMKDFSPNSFSLVSSNKHCGNEVSWNVIGGTAITVDERFLSHRV